MAKNINEEKIKEALKRGVSEVIDYSHLEKRLLAGEKLRVKLGIDPTSPNLHLGRASMLLKLRDFQDLGCQIVFIVGDFTGLIGDTSDKESERPMLAKERIEENMKSYILQAGKILDMKKVETRYNSEWLKKLGYEEIGKQANCFSLAEFVARENIKKRLGEGKRISLRELLYPLMQGYDSVMVKADLEIGGTDQRFNLLTGREMQILYGQKPQDILMTTLIAGTDGRKMSSSWGNTINILDEPADMFGKVMSIPDNLILDYFVHCTRVLMEKIKEYEAVMAMGTANPRDIKMDLAFEAVKTFHGEKNAESAKKSFISVFQKKETPEQIEWISDYGDNIIEALVSSGMARSNSEAQRLIKQKGIKVDGKIVESFDFAVKSGNIIQKGKRSFIKLK